MTQVLEAGREAVRSLTATPRRFGLLLAVIAAATSVLAVREARFTEQLRDEAIARVEAGEFIYTADFFDASVTGVRADGCERLATLPGIIASGAESDEPPVSFDGHPSGAYRSALITPGRLTIADQRQLIDAGASLPPLLIGSAAANEMGLRSRATVAIDGAPIEAASLQATGARSSTLDRAVISLAAPSLTRGICYVEFEAASAEEAATILPALLADDVPEGLNVRPLITRDSLGPTPVNRFTSRPDRWLWAILVAMTFLPVVMVTRARRTELVTYAMFGATPGWISLVLMFESLILAALAASIGLSALIVAEPGAIGIMGPAAESAGRYLLWLLLLQIVLAIVLPVRQTKLYELLRQAD